MMYPGAFAATTPDKAATLMAGTAVDIEKFDPKRSGVRSLISWNETGHVRDLLAD